MSCILLSKATCCPKPYVPVFRPHVNHSFSAKSVQCSEINLLIELVVVEFLTVRCGNVKARTMVCRKISSVIYEVESSSHGYELYSHKLKCRLWTISVHTKLSAFCTANMLYRSHMTSNTFFILFLMQLGGALPYRW
jgi:hypothetical protein